MVILTPKSFGLVFFQGFYPKQRIESFLYTLQICTEFRRVNAWFNIYAVEIRSGILYLKTDNLRTIVYNDFYNFLKGNHDYGRNGTYTDWMYAGGSGSESPIQPKTQVSWYYHNCCYRNPLQDGYLERDWGLGMFPERMAGDIFGPALLRAFGSVYSSSHVKNYFAVYELCMDKFVCQIFSIIV